MKRSDPPVRTVTPTPGPAGDPRAAERPLRALRAWTCPRCGLIRDELAHVHAVAHACPATGGRFVDLAPTPQPKET